MNNNMKFQLELSGSKIDFLDIQISINEGKDETDMYCKSTDTKQYLKIFSNHLRHIKRALPYNPARRICSIVSIHDSEIKRPNEL